MSLALPEPDRAIMRHATRSSRTCAGWSARGAIIADEDGRRAYETDALTAYRRLPLAVALPTTTEEVSRLLRYCHANGIKVVARGAGTSLSGGALPAEDAVVIGVSRMNRMLDIDYHEPHRPRGGRHHQSRHQRGGEGAGLLLRARSRPASSPARSPATSA